MRWQEEIHRVLDRAKEWHANQTYGECDYINGHILPVYRLVSEKIPDKASEEYKKYVLSSTILHDVLEDTNATYQDIAALFGIHVALCVDSLSDSPGKNRRERKLRTYYKIRMNPETTMIKVADRLINMRNCDLNNKNLLKMYMKEHDIFFAALWSPNQMYQDWWDEMEAIIEKNKNEKSH